MARHFRKRGRAATNKKIAYKKPSARNQQRQILDINKKVNKVERIIRGIVYKVVHSTRISLVLTATPTVPYQFLPLNRLSQMNQVFSAPGEAAGGKYNIDGRGRFNFNFTIALNHEIEPQYLTAFIVSPKNMKVALSLGLTTMPMQFNMINDVDYVNNLGGEGVFFNNKRFNVHKMWKLSCLPAVSYVPGTTVPNVSTYKAVRRSFSMKNPLHLNNRQGTWNDPATAPDNSVTANQQLYLVIFNNNAATPLSYARLNGQTLVSAYTSE